MVRAQLIEVEEATVIISFSDDRFSFIRSKDCWSTMSNAQTKGTHHAFHTTVLFSSPRTFDVSLTSSPSASSKNDTEKSAYIARTDEQRD